MRLHHLLLVPAVFVLAVVRPAAGKGSVLLHEQIPPDAHDDLAMGVTIAGGMPAAMETRSGVVSAPDPSRKTTKDELSAQAQAQAEVPNDTYTPDRDTRRPQTLPYTDPFTPSTAPFKRLAAFDAVNDKFELVVANAALGPLIVGGVAGPAEDRFYADVPLRVRPGRPILIPSVGPGARVLHAQLADGARELAYRLYQNGAEEWYLQASETADARLVMELAIPRATFGSEMADRPWGDLPPIRPVPELVAAAAQDVLAKLGLGKQLTPRENVRRLVAHFRSFVDSDTPLAPSRDVYTDLALSMKGVCRHRAYAFTVTALALGIPTRMVINEAHAWVEVNDGEMWHRIDLGGAGQMLADTAKTTTPYAPPPDPFQWPAGATRGEDLASAHRPPSSGNGGGSAPASSSSGGSSSSNGGSNGGSSSANSSSSNRDDRTGSGTKDDPRPASTLTLKVEQRDALRGTAVHLQGAVRADGDACANVAVAIILRAANDRDVRVGTLVTDADGNYQGTVTLPTSVPLGDHHVMVRTDGGGRCGGGVGP